MVDFKKNARIVIDQVEDYYGYACCENCLKSGRTRLEIHHIIFRSEKPKHPDIHHLKNLILLCSECHQLFHDKKSLRNKLVKERELANLFGDDVNIVL